MECKEITKFGPHWDFGGQKPHPWALFLPTDSVIWMSNSSLVSREADGIQDTAKTMCGVVAGARERMNWTGHPFDYGVCGVVAVVSTAFGVDMMSRTPPQSPSKNSIAGHTDTCARQMQKDEMGKLETSFATHAPYTKPADFHARVEQCGRERAETAFKNGADSFDGLGAVAVGVAVSALAYAWFVTTRNLKKDKQVLKEAPVALRQVRRNRDAAREQAALLEFQENTPF